MRLTALKQRNVTIPQQNPAFELEKTPMTFQFSLSESHDAEDHIILEVPMKPRASIMHNANLIPH